MQAHIIQKTTQINHSTNTNDIQTNRGLDLVRQTRRAAYHRIGANAVPLATISFGITGAVARLAATTGPAHLHARVNTPMLTAIEEGCHGCMACMAIG